MRKVVLAVLSALVLWGCNASDVVDEVTDAVNDPERKTIDVSRLGMNAFVNDGRFGSASQQFAEVRDRLKISQVRVLFNWDDGVQDSPGAELNFGFMDNVVNSLPGNMRAVVVLAGLPSWMGSSGNWVNGNPRTTFVERFVRPVVTRYRDSDTIIAWEVWNEPNMETAQNGLLGITTNPTNYVEMLAQAHSVIKSIAPGDLVLNAATTAINQNFSGTLDYNRAMRDAGALSFTDRFNVHYYGKQFENVTRPGGVEDFLDGLSQPIWITESGAQGVNSQLAYGEQVWPYLFDKIERLERVYVYQFTESSPADVTYGLKNPSTDFPVSDLYVHLAAR